MSSSSSSDSAKKELANKVMNEPATIPTIAEPNSTKVGATPELISQKKNVK